VSVILPTYNEAGNIVDLVRAIDQAITQPHEIIVVDDNSPDGTSRLIQDVIAQGSIPGLKLETRLTDRGLTKSIQRGIDLAQGDTVVWLDCDFSMPPFIIPQLLAKIEEGRDIAVASRFVAGGKYKESQQWFGGEESRAAILLSRMLNWFLRHALFASFTDYTSGFIAIRKDVLNRLRLQGDYGEYFIDLIFRAILLGYTFVEIPYENVPRRAGESKTGSSFVHLFKRGLPYLGTIFKMWGLRLKYLLGGDILGQ
jgi:dolichol-phosphate mannosyltransferase